ncbi:MAG: response regulator transcription factor [Bacteroidales bacterium]|nr:response regulator transcription factor [Bacteroidales bacterium]
MEKISVFLVDDHALFRQGLRMLLSRTDFIDEITEFGDARSMLKALPEKKPTIVLLDIEMPVMNGIEACSEALKIDPETLIIALSMYGDDEYYYRMIAVGARGFLLKNSEIDQVEEAILKVCRGGSYFSPEILMNLVKNKLRTDEQQQLIQSLTERELEVLRLICQGQNNQEIGDKLFISKRTVEKHRENLLSKTHSNNTASLIVFAVKHKIVQV